MIIVGIYGGIGSGKSTVGRFLKELGAYVLSADEENKNLLKDEIYLSRLKKVFPEVFQSGNFNKSQLRDLIFSQPEKRELLNKLSHPLIIDRIKGKLKEPITFVELPIYLEEFKTDINILVSSNLGLQVGRASSRDNRSIEDIKKIIKAQTYFNSIPNPIIIDNTSTLEALENKVTDIFVRINKEFLDIC